MKGEILIICGSTAVGKSALALDLSKYLNIEIISADSMQIYKSLDIGTSKPTTQEKKICPHHMIDIVSPFDSFNTFQFTQRAHSIIVEIWQRGNLPVIVGGTGLYIESLIKHYYFCNDAKNQDSQNEYNARVVCLYRDRKLLYQIINDRVDDMIKNGLVDEVKVLRSIGVNSNCQCMQAIGYKEIWEFLEDNLSLNEAIEKIKQNTRNYAKRQLTWFRHMECEWINIDSERDKLIKDLVGYYKQYKK